MLRLGCIAAICVIAVGCGRSHRNNVVDDMGMQMPDLGNLDIGTPLPPVRIDTDTGVTEVTAGTPITVSCPLFDMNDVFVPVPEGSATSVSFSPMDSVTRNDDGTFTATTAGEVEFVCVLRVLGLADDTPARVRIVPGPPAEVTTSLDVLELTAGEGAVTASCLTVDEYGNVIDPANVDPALQITPTGGTIDANAPLTASFEIAGQYSLSCDVPGAVSRPEGLTVNPNLPANIVVSVVPDQDVYGAGDVIELAYVVTDRFGNVVPGAEAMVTSSPGAGQNFGDGRFRFFEDGDYVLTATVLGETQDDIPLSASATVTLNGEGPTIVCDNGVMLNATPGETFTLNGSVADATGVMSLAVNGTNVAVASDGSWSSDSTARFGMNFFDVVAVDALGEENSQTCMVLLADNFQAATGSLDDVVTLALGQQAIDDGGGPSELDSLNDLLETALRSSELNQQIDDLVGNLVIVPNECQQEVCVPFIGCTCVARVGVRGVGASLGNNGDTSITLRNGGINVSARLNNVSASARATAKVPIIPELGVTVTALVRRVDVDLSFDVGLSGGRPVVTIRSSSVDLTGLSIDSSLLGGILDPFINLIVLAFEDAIVGAIVPSIEGLIEDNFDAILDGVLGNLDISSFGSTIAVPNLSGGSIPLSFGIGFSHINTNTTRLLVGIGTSFTAPVANARPTLGVPLPPGAVRLDPGLNSNTTAVGVHIGVFNQVLHTLWRGGMFDGVIDASAFGGGLPAGLTASLDTDLPPVARLADDGSVELGIGAMTIDLVYPGVFDDGITIEFGARASLNPSLNGEDLDFGGITIDELFFNTPGVSLDMVNREILETFLAELVQEIADAALNDALPTLPIPSFALPAVVSDFGLPANAELGLLSPSLGTEGNHFVLRGDFGVRP